MKKILAFAALACVSVAAQAQDTFSGSTLWGHCTTAYTSMSFNTGSTAGTAMQLPASAIKAFSGCKITAIAVANGTPASCSKASEMPISLFVSETLGATPLQSYQGQMNLTRPLEYNEYNLPEAITITESMQPLYFGFTVKCDREVANPIVTDATASATAGPGDWYGLENTDGSWTWEQARSYYGFPCVRIKIEGNKLPANEVNILECHLPTDVTPGADAAMGLIVRNEACNPIESLTIGYTFNNSAQQSITVDLPSPLLYNDYNTSALTVKLPIPQIQGSDLPLAIDIAGVNGVQNNASAPNRKREVSLLSLAGGFEKAMVVEIGTATSCGWCPRGIVGVESMTAAHKDDGRFIPIAVHTGDRLAVQSYDMYFSDDYAGASTPTCLVNRNTETFGIQDPVYSFLESAYAEVTSHPALCSVSINGAEFDAVKKTVKIDASAEFAIDAEGEFGFAYVITENGVGPYDQTNYFAPELQYGMKLEWWDQQPNPVKVTYDAIARNIYSFRGLKGSVPAQVKAGTPVAHSATVQTNLVSDMNNTDIIVMVVNRKTGRIENAAKAPFAGFASINAVSAGGSAARAEYFDLQGRRVQAPAPGMLLIERRGASSRKILFQ